MGKEQLNGSVDALASALRDVIREAVNGAVAGLATKEDLAVMEKRLLDKMEANRVDHEAWIRNLDEKVTRLDDRVGHLDDQVHRMETHLFPGEE